jgi:lipopolysaccharide/colanic/teichoic acid biosynthesis glycosyltransferase
MLIEPDQLVAFDIAEIAEAMVWSKARGTGIRIIERSDEGYKEQIVRSGAGEVVGIRRSYVHDEKIGYRIIMTSEEAVARNWAAASERRSGWLTARRDCHDKMDHQKVYGHCYDLKLIEDHRRFLSWVIATWDDPDRVLDGIIQVRPGIFVAARDMEKVGSTCIAPAWIGFRCEDVKTMPIVGPDFVTDASPVGPSSSGVRVLGINEIMLPRGRAKERLIPYGSLYGIGKRLFDLFWAVTILVLLTPIFLLVAVLVVIDDGFPLFFGHVRQKKGGRTFRCWKFRTMRREAESMVAELQAMNKADGPQVFIESDPRVTRVGRYLRKLQLDELPQFWNVLVGDMSVVGPRPSPDKENQFCPAWREMRLSVRPGITGLWQVKRTRSPGEDFQEWIKYDIDYVRTASFRLDVQICFKTAWNIIARK